MSFFLSCTWHLFVQQMRITLRMPVWVVIAIVQPIIWLVLFGQLFKVMATLPGFENASYQQFLAPGLVVLSSIMSSAYSGMGILHDIEQGVFDRLLATPVHRSALLLARLFQSSVMVMLQGVVILVVAWCFGVRAPGGFLGVVSVLLAAALIGAAASAASNGLALIVRNMQVLVPMINFVMLPALFLSSMMMSRDLMPEWIRRVTAFNPLDWGVRVARTGFEGQAWTSVGPQIALLFGCLTVAWILALESFDRYRAAL